MHCINQWSGEHWALYQGDSCEVIKGIPDNSVHFSIFSPPFSSIFVYSDSERDMGNCPDDETFFTHFKFLIPEINRITKPGRLCAVHCSDLPMHKYKDGHIGLKDFPGKIISAFVECGWVFHSRVVIWKDPVVEMQRTKALGLLHKQITKDSTRCRQGIADQLLVFGKSGDNEEPVSRANGFNPREYVGEMQSECQTSIDVWQRYASPVWMDINQTNVLNVRVARGDKDERHLCPLQLDVIERAIHLWTNTGDVVFTPFAGIGSEIYSAVKMGRKGVGIELKEEYCIAATRNMASIEEQNRQLNLLEG
jgi:DNA modification methylase